MPKPEETAARVVAAINLGGEQYALTDDPIGYGRGGMRVSFIAADGKPMLMSLDASG